MNAPVCTSKWQCTLHGLSGTAVAVSVVALGWLAFQMLSGGAMNGIKTLIWLWFVPFGPSLLSVLYAGLMRWQARPMGWFGLTFTILGAVWAVIMLNTVRHL